MVHVDWGNLEESLLVWKIDDDNTIADLEAAFTQSQMMLLQKDHILHWFVDVQRVSYVDEALLCTLYTCIMHRSKNLQRTVIISQNPLWRSFWTSLLGGDSMLHAQVFFVSSANDAYHLVEDVLI